ncbi:uncharacterized protein TRIVIDRAFT_63875 [Trichoderma virens Gv29-8]|uniref:Uncharacterized protein n=1 Tax=Hypocrea virens (strain Gv29-8 / FGSC 10586) TaxID=413071 RepID=G9MPA5_HYPVG|nr:uncharacterized protein TRIVIDRAFT_63875 [Trichoderma virens Gv29-8]EHK23707.1 hypothetical protein TRIVIDRAFT_63875 [Trichoderma virens Gv29-8]UKZ50003.1 hypothetical protein TrVGV298_004258 [Trichoderma virens]
MRHREGWASGCAGGDACGLQGLAMEGTGLDVAGLGAVRDRQPVQVPQVPLERRSWGGWGGTSTGAGTSASAFTRGEGGGTGTGNDDAVSKGWPRQDSCRVQRGLEMLKAEREMFAVPTRSGSWVPRHSPPRYANVAPSDPAERGANDLLGLNEGG